MADPLSKQGDGSFVATRSGTLWSDLPRSLRGYEPAATEALLAGLASTQADLERECRALRDRAVQLEADLVEHRRREELVSKALLEATDHATMIRENAREEAESILRRAHAELESRAERAERAERERTEAERELIRLRSLTQDLESSLARILTDTLGQLRLEDESWKEGGDSSSTSGDAREALTTDLEGVLTRPDVEPHSELAP